MIHKIKDTFNNYVSYIRKKPVIVLTGVHGFLGSRIYSYFSKHNFIIPLNRNKIDIYDLNSLKNFFSKKKPDYLIHCAAISNPDYCEKNKNEAKKANVDYTNNLVEICKYQNIKMIFISTSMVFKPATDKKFYYTENSIPDAENYYGITKIEAEEAVKKLDNYLIIRIGWQYSDLKDRYPNTNSMLHYIYNELIRNKKISVNKNSYGNPTYVYDTIKKLFEVFKDYTGILHISSETDKSMDYHFIETAKKLGLNPDNIEVLDNPVENQKIKSERISFK